MTSQGYKKVVEYGKKIPRKSMKIKSKVIINKIHVQKKWLMKFLILEKLSIY